MESSKDEWSHPKMNGVIQSDLFFSVMKTGSGLLFFCALMCKSKWVHQSGSLVKLHIYSGKKNPNTWSILRRKKIILRFTSHVKWFNYYRLTLLWLREKTKILYLEWIALQFTFVAAKWKHSSISRRSPTGKIKKNISFLSNVLMRQVSYLL